MGSIPELELIAQFQFWNLIFKTNGIGIDKFGIGIDKFGIDKFGIDKFDVELELAKWN